MLNLKEKQSPYIQLLCPMPRHQMQHSRSIVRHGFYFYNNSLKYSPRKLIMEHRIRYNAYGCILVPAR